MKLIKTSFGRWLHTWLILLHVWQDSVVLGTVPEFLPEDIGPTHDGTCWISATLPLLTQCLSLRADLDASPLLQGSGPGRRAALPWQRLSYTQDLGGGCQTSDCTELHSRRWVWGFCVLLQPIVLIRKAEQIQGLFYKSYFISPDFLVSPSSQRLSCMQ